jgi:hypothetical protein
MNKNVTAFPPVNFPVMALVRSTSQIIDHINSLILLIYTHHARPTHSSDHRKIYRRYNLKRVTDHFLRVLMIPRFIYLPT